MKSTQIPILRIIILLVLIISGAFMVFKTMDQLKITNLAQARVNNLSQGVDRLSSIANSLPEIEDLVAGWQRSLPANEEDVATFAAAVEQIGKDNKMVVSLNFADFPQVAVVGGQKYDGLMTDIVLEGSYQGLIGFVRGMSYAPYFYKIDKLAIAKNQLRAGLKITLNGTLMMNLAK